MAELEKVLSFRAILLITINSIIGTGIFFLPAIGAVESSTASFWAWIIMGSVAMYLSLVFAELTGMFPNSGGVYEFCKQAFGPTISFFVGYLTLVISYITIAMLIVGAVVYLIPFDAPFIQVSLAIGFIIVFHYIAYAGMQTSAFMLMAFALITLGALFSIMIPGVGSFSVGNLNGLFALQAGSLFTTVFLIAETFFGWETATFLAGETKNGEKVVPIALILGTFIIVILAGALVFISFGAVGADNLAANSNAPFSYLAKKLYPGSPENADFGISLVVYLAIIGAVAGWIVSAPRLIKAMSDDKLFIKQLAAIHPQKKTPYKAIIFQGILTSTLVIVSLSSYEKLLHLLIPLVLLQYGTMAVVLVVLRYKLPNQKRTFKVPGPAWLSLFVLPIFGYITYMWVTHTKDAVQVLTIGAALVFTGFPIYLLVKVYHDPNFIIWLNDRFAWFNYLTEGILLSKEVKRDMLILSGDIHSKRVFEYGCSVGSLTTFLAEKIDRFGVLYASNISSKELSITKKRVSKRGHTNVVYIHDKDQVAGINQDVKNIDVVISFGMLSAMQDQKKILKELHSVLATGGRICLVDYIDYFHILPNPAWLSNDSKIKSMFWEAGFTVTITKKKGHLWNYIFIHGVKSKPYNDMVYI